MKITSIFLGVLLITFIIIQLFAIRSQWNIETYPYEVTKTYDQFEIRRYESTLFTSCDASDVGGIFAIGIISEFGAIKINILILVSLL